jgi:hypothetical protein
MQSFKIVAYLLLGYFWLVGTEILVNLKASLATAEVSTGALAEVSAGDFAKADQQCL